MADPNGLDETVHPIRLALSRVWPRMSVAALARELKISEATLRHYLVIPPRRVPPDGFYGAVAVILNKAQRDAIASGHAVKVSPEQLRPEAVVELITAREQEEATAVA